MAYLDNTGLSRLVSDLKARLVPQTRKVNGKALNADITLGAGDITYGSPASTVGATLDSQQSAITANTAALTAQQAILTPDAVGQALMGVMQDNTLVAMFRALLASDAGYSNAAVPGITNAGNALDWNIAHLLGLQRQNGLFDGGMEVRQRGTSFAINGSAYTLDRWFCTGTDVQVSYSASKPTGSMSSGSLQMGKTGGNAGITQLMQIVEYPQLYAGKTVALGASIFNYGSVDAAIGIIVADSAGTLSWVSITEIQKDEAWHEYIAVMTIPIGITSLRFVVQANFAGVPIPAGLFLTEARLVIGDTVGPYIPRPYGQELALCQRYFLRIGSVGAVALGTMTSFTAGEAFGHIGLPTTMRTTPTISNSGTISIRIGAAMYSVTAFSNVSQAGNGISLQCNAAGLPINATGLLQTASAGAYVDADSEIYP